MKPILIASGNKHKAEEFDAIFKLYAGNKYKIVTPDTIFDKLPDATENGTSFGANARIKADAFYKACYMASFADDSGLEVDALDGNPGINSARYAGTHGDDAANRKKIIDELKEKGLSESTARFVCVICYVDGAIPCFSKGICEGKVVTRESGDGGFGYDPIFIPEGYDKTFAELNSEEKNKISHRSVAARKFISYLEMPT